MVSRGGSGHPFFCPSTLRQAQGPSVNLRPLFVGYVETTKSKIRYDERQRHWLEVADD